MTFRPIVETVEDGALLRWRGRLGGLPGLFEGMHELRVEATLRGKAVSPSANHSVESWSR
jgi:hypothetical protein